jgi:hypothetical protein
MWRWLSETMPYREANVRGDTYPVTWADDDRLYLSAGDPMCGELAYKGWFSHCGGLNGAEHKSAPIYNTASETGLDVQAIDGTPPDHRVTRVHAMPNLTGLGGGGPKPCGMLAIDGRLYLAFQNLLGLKKPVHGTSQHGSDAALTFSDDQGKTWSIDGLAEWELRRFGPFFSGSAFGGPSFVQYGKNYANAVDGFVYAVSTDQWDNGSHLRIGRVPRASILDRAAWQWVSGFGQGNAPEWSNDLDDAIPVLSRARRISLPEMVYLRNLNRYVLLTWSLVKDFTPNQGSRLTIYESPAPWGPFEIFHEEDPWLTPEHGPYCPRLPLKWYSPSTNTGWFLHSGNWTGEEAKQHYRVNVRKFRLEVGT